MQLPTMENNIISQIRSAILAEFPTADVEVQGAGGHFTISVFDGAFSGKLPLQAQRSVLRTIKHLMAGDGAPVHAIDKLIVKESR